MSNKIYYRPIPQCDAARPEAARVLAGGWCWFDQVEILERNVAPKLVAASDIPAAALARLTSPRADIAGMDLSRPRVMGILNVTPDSFSDGGEFAQIETALKGAREMIGQGVDMIDIGGESTRPGARYVPADEEMARVVPVIAAIRGDSDVPISVDTRKAPVGQAALDAGATLVNDVYAFTHDPDLMQVVAAAAAPVCLMHAQGDPDVMQQDPQYDNVLLDVYDFLEARVAAADAAGIPRHRILVDPGIGFGKTLAHNLALLGRLSLFHSLGCGVLLGVSRKGFIGHVGDVPMARDRGPGTLALTLAGIAQGIQVHRVHDVAETKQALTLWHAATGGQL